MNLWGSSVCYLLKLHPLLMSNLAPSDTLSPPPCGWMHFKEPRWTREPGPVRLVEPNEKKMEDFISKMSSAEIPAVVIADASRQFGLGSSSGVYGMYGQRSQTITSFFIIDWYFRSVSEKWIRIFKIISQRNLIFIFHKLLSSLPQTLRKFFSKLSKNSVN